MMMMKYNYMLRDSITVSCLLAFLIVLIHLSQFLCTIRQLTSVVDFYGRVNHVKYLLSSYAQNLCLLNFSSGGSVRAAALQLPLLGVPMLRQI